MSDIKELTNEIKKFCAQRNWKQFHDPKDLALSLTLVSSNRVATFVESKIDWISRKLNYFNTKPIPTILKGGKREYLKNKEAAYDLAKIKVDYFNQFYNFPYKKISIKNQKTRWGSCSGKGNLNFNFKIIYLPDELQNYLIVHELCHLKEFNHSKRFWDLVALQIPDYKQIRKRLKNVR